MSTILRLVYLTCAVVVAWFGVQYSAEAMSRHDRSAAYWCIGATAIVAACLIDWAVQRKRKEAK